MRWTISAPYAESWCDKATVPAIPSVKASASANKSTGGIALYCDAVAGGALDGLKGIGEKKLDELFDQKAPVEGANASPDISGLIGQYAHGNEPSHHIAYLYDYAGQPWKTQALVRRLVDTVSESGHIFLISLGPATVKEQELKMLEREMEVVQAT